MVDGSRTEIQSMNEKVHAFRAQFMDYRLLETIREDLHMLVDRDNTAAEGAVMTLIGASGTGKTKFIEDFVDSYPREPHAIRHGDGRIADRATVVLVAVPDTGVKSLTEEIYSSLTGVEPPANSRGDLQKAIYKYAVEMETKLFIFEEAHEASVDDTNKTMKAVARLFKQFSNKASFSVLIVGTEEADRLVRTNKELKRRSLGRHQLLPLGWDDPKGRSFFIGLLRQWDSLLEPVLVRAGLDDERLALKIHISSDGGIIGLAAVLVERAALLAVRDRVRGKTRGSGQHARPILGIDELHLHEAHRLLDRGDRNPFSSDLPGEHPDRNLAEELGARPDGPGALRDEPNGLNAAEDDVPPRDPVRRGGGRRAARDRVFRP